MVFAISRNLEGVDDNSLLVFVCDDFIYFKDCMDLADSLIEDFEMKGVMVLVNKDTETFAAELKKSGVKLEALWFVDCLSLISGLGQPGVPNCITVSHPSDYQSILTAVTQALDSMKSGKKFVMFISPHMLKKYTEIDELGMFFGQFKEFMYKKKAFDVIMIERENDVMFEQLLTNMADKVMVG